MKDKNIFVSGGAGVIGSELIPKLLAIGANIFVGDLKSKPSAWPGTIRYRQGDLNYLSWEEIADFNPHIFIHLAATFERSTETYDFWQENFWHNVHLSNHLMSLFKNTPALERVVFASSYLIYDQSLYQFDQPQTKAYRLDENDVINPRNLCGSAKLNHEIELNFLNHFKQEQFTSACARIFRGYGRGSKCVISRWIRELLKGNPIDVYKQEGIFDYIFAGDIADGLVRIINCPEIRGVINLGTDNARKVADILPILKVYFPEMKVNYSNLDIPFEASQANMGQFKSYTGWIPAMQLEETIPLIIEHQKNQKETPESSTKHVLITSISKKISLVKQVEQATRKINDQMKVFGGDVNEECLANYFVSEFWKMPRTDNLTIETLITYCKDNGIRAIIPTRDGELNFFSEHKNILAENGISVMVSVKSVIDYCLDKLKFYQDSIVTNLPIIPTFENIDKVDSDLYVVKERYEAGSDFIGLELNKEEAREHAGKLNHPIFQPFIAGEEVSIDMYIAKGGVLKGVIMRARDAVVNGESQITTTFYDKNLVKVCQDFVAFKPYYGHIILQAIRISDGSYYIIECNSRFGGASTLSVSAGLDSFYWFLLESYNEDVSSHYFKGSRAGIRQIRYPADKIVLV